MLMDNNVVASPNYKNIIAEIRDNGFQRGALFHRPGKPAAQRRVDFNQGVDARILWTRFRGSTKSAQELSAAAKGELGLKELGSKLGYRVAFSEALARGMTVLEWPERTARVEFQAVGKEIKRILGVKS